jgi:hypothetical protein
MSKDVHTAVYAEDIVVNHDRQCQKVKHVREICPDMRRAILPYAFRVKAIGLED